MDTRRFRTWFTFALLASDALASGTAFLLGYRLRVLIPWPLEAAELDRLSAYLPVMLLQMGSVALVFFLMRLYHLARATSRVDEFYKIVGGLTAASLLAVALASLSLKNSIFETNLPRMMILYAWLVGILLVSFGRWVLQRLRALLQARGILQDRVIIIGAGDKAELVTHKIQGSPYLGYRLLGLVAPEADVLPGATEPPAALAGLPVIGRTGDLPRLLDERGVDVVIIALPEISDEALVDLISRCHRERVSIKVFPDLFDIMAASVGIDDLGGLPLLSVRDVALRGWSLSFKRGMDLAGSALGLIFLSPFLMLLAILIKLESRGPVFFVQERMGLDAKPFPMIKFRSMRTDSEANGPGWTVKNDPRVTRLGRFIRRTSIDELPQLINVLLGDMSLVGPRPEQPAFVLQFQRMIPRYMERHREKAGLTGWAQVNGLRGDTSIAERTKYDLWYIENWSIWLDIKILLRTGLKIFRDPHAY